MSLSNHKYQNLSDNLKVAGLIAFFIGIVIFSGSLFIGNYQVSEQTLMELNEIIPENRLTRLSPLIGKQYTSKTSLLRAIENHLNDDGKVQPYELSIFKIAILKSTHTGLLKDNPGWFFLASIFLASLGVLMFTASGLARLPGIKNDHIFHSSATNRGIIGYVTGIYLIIFYVMLYWYPEYIVNLIILTDPISEFMRNKPADRWFLYGTLYTFAVIVMGARMLVKYRHNRYHLVRTASVIFFQFIFAFLAPALMERLNRPGFDLKNAWPLNYSLFMDWNLNNLINSGHFGWFLLFWGIALSLVVVPVMTYFFGKRWYCSWVCGCGGLAETLGDPYRQLSNKSVKAWKIERWTIYLVLVFAIVMTIIQIVNYMSDGVIFSNYTWRINQLYSFVIGSAFAGVIGTGFYPIMGNRVWCRFGCPLAAILGLMQKFKSRFVITTNGQQCISCGNCSTYCEMGIDVRWYAQRSQNIVRASCVGCGVCSAVCPRGVLKLENTAPEARFNIVIDDAKLSG